MDFFDFSKEARIKEETRIKALENNVINKAIKMASNKFSKVYGGTTQVIAKTANLREFKRNYLSGKIASELCISTKQGTKNIPFTILVKASEPSILESDQIIFEKVASAEGSLDAEINSILGKQEQKLANLEAEEQTNKKIIADLAKGISLEASRKNHIFKEAAKSKKKVERNSLSTATTPTDFLGDVVEYFTYPKTFFPAMKVGAIIDIAGVKYKYIGDEATMTEPAGNTNGTIARFELANKKKASLNKEAVLDVEALIAELYEEIKAMRGDWGGYDPLEYTVIEAKATADGRTIIQVRDELSYEGMVRLAERLNPIIQKVDPESYFEQVEPGIMEAYLGDGGTKTYASSKSNLNKKASDIPTLEELKTMKAADIFDLLDEGYITKKDGELFNEAINRLVESGAPIEPLFTREIVTKDNGELYYTLINTAIKKGEAENLIKDNLISKEEVSPENMSLFNDAIDKLLDADYNYSSYLLLNKFITKNDEKLYNKALEKAMGDSDSASDLLIFDIITKNDGDLYDKVLEKAKEDESNLVYLIPEHITKEDGDLFNKAIKYALHNGLSFRLLLNGIVTKEEGSLFTSLVKQTIEDGEEERLVRAKILSQKELDAYKGKENSSEPEEEPSIEEQQGEILEEEDITSEIPEEILNSVVGQQKGMSASEVWRQMGSELGYAGRGCIVIYQRLQKANGGNTPVTFRDVYNVAKSKKGTSKIKEDKDEKAYEQLITDDKAMLDYIGDAEDLKDTGTKLKRGEEVSLLVDRFESNAGLPENRVNDILIDIIVGDPDTAYKTLCYLFPDSVMSDKGTTYDDSSISNKYKTLLLESAASKYPGKVKRIFKNIAEKYLDSYRGEKEYEEEQKYTPMMEGEFAYSVVEDFLSTRPSKEKLEKYLEKYNVMNNIDNEIKKYEEILKSIDQQSKEEINKETK